MFDPKVKVKKTDVKDAENTILWIETYDSDFRAYWTEPKDAMYKGETPPNLFPKPYTNQFQAMMADGKWRYLDKNRDSKNIPNMFLRNPAK